MTPPAQRIGLIAGAGDIPPYFAKKAQDKGIPVVSISLTEDIGRRLSPLVDRNHSIGIGQAGKIRKTLEMECVTQLLLLGKVEKNMVFRWQKFDLEALKFLRSLKSHQDKSIMTTIIREAEKQGVTVLDQKEFIPELFPEEGVLTRRRPSKKQQEDIRFGMPIARSMADQEIGQTLVVKNRTVIAVEGVEGTDAAIDRGCSLAHGECTVIKVSRTAQDYRFDSPGIGPDTVEHLARGKASVLALEAGRVMVMDRTRVLERADRAGLAVVCV
ncbi:MAG: LpxI family protein [Nitrospinaceae bacterium]